MHIYAVISTIVTVGTPRGRGMSPEQTSTYRMNRTKRVLPVLCFQLPMEATLQFGECLAVRKWSLFLIFTLSSGLGRVTG